MVQLSDAWWCGCLLLGAGLLVLQLGGAGIAAG